MHQCGTYSKEHFQRTKVTMLYWTKRQAAPLAGMWAWCYDSYDVMIWPVCPEASHEGVGNSNLLWWLKCKVTIKIWPYLKEVCFYFWKCSDLVCCWPTLQETVTIAAQHNLIFRINGVALSQCSGGFTIKFRILS